MDELPPEVLANVFLRLPLNSLLHCTKVCKNFRNTILHDTLFADMHIIRNADRKLPSLVFCNNNKLYFIDFNAEYEDIKHINRLDTDTVCICFTPPIDIEIDSILSCDGLLCLCEGPPSRNPICVVNPVTRDHVILPRSRQEPICENFISGFGLDRLTKEYKVLRLMHMKEDNDMRSSSLVGEVYIVGSDYWRSIGNVPLLIFEEHHKTVNIFGALHWMGRHSSSAQYPEFIVAWNITDEKFYELPLPEELDPNKDGWYLSLVKYRDCLSILHFYDRRNMMSIWKLKDYYDKRSWVKEEKEIPSTICDWDLDESSTIRANIQSWYGTQHLFLENRDEETVSVMYRGGVADFSDVQVNGYLDDDRVYHLQVAAHVGSFISISDIRSSKKRRIRKTMDEK